MPVQVESLRDAFLQALLRSDARAADVAAREAIDAGLDELSISEKVIAPALRSMWDMVERGLVAEEDEEEATRISLRVLALQREAFRRALQRGGEGVVLAEIEGDVLTPRLNAAAQRLAGAGFRVHCLGRGVSVHSLARVVAQEQPLAVVLYVSTREGGITLDYALEEIQLAAEGTRIVAGGPGVPPDMSESEDLTTWESPREIVAKVDSLVLRPALN